MTTARILNQAQAEAVYSAMCALNEVAHCDGIRISFPGEVDGQPERIRVDETDKDVIRVSYRGGLMDAYREYHDGQTAFATAYGLNNDAAPAVCSECGGRGEIETGIGMMVCTSCPV